MPKALVAAAVVVIVDVLSDAVTQGTHCGFRVLRYTYSRWMVRQKRSIHTLSRHLALPSMLMRIPYFPQVLCHSSQVYCTMRDAHTTKQVRHPILYPAALAQAFERIYRSQAHQSHQTPHELAPYMVALSFEVIYHLAYAHRRAQVILLVHEIHHLQVIGLFTLLTLVVGCAQLLKPNSSASDFLLFKAGRAFLSFISIDERLS